jgi:hypothetical protein
MIDELSAISGPVDTCIHKFQEHSAAFAAFVALGRNSLFTRGEYKPDQINQKDKNIYDKTVRRRVGQRRSCRRRDLFPVRLWQSVVAVGAVAATAVAVDWWRRQHWRRVRERRHLRSGLLQTR